MVLAVGSFNFILKVQASDDESMEALFMANSRGGNVRAEFARAYALGAWKEIVNRIPS